MKKERTHVVPMSQVAAVGKAKTHEAVLRLQESGQSREAVLRRETC